jgi:hypothetical protein
MIKIMLKFNLHKKYLIIYDQINIFYWNFKFFCLKLLL